MNKVIEDREMAKTVNTAIISYSFMDNGSDVQYRSSRKLEPNGMEPLNRCDDHDTEGFFKSLATTTGRLFGFKRNNPSSLPSKAQIPVSVTPSVNPDSEECMSLETSTMGILNSTGTFYE